MTGIGDSSQVEEFGLKIPTGHVVWPPELWNGRSFNTPEDRAALFNAIQESETRLGFAPGELLARYSWVIRTVATVVFTGHPEVPLSETVYSPPVLTRVDEEAPAMESTPGGEGSGEGTGQE